MTHSPSALAAESDAIPELQPISLAEPCGPGLEYDPEYAVLQAQMQPRGDAQYGEFVGRGEASNWADIERDCRRLLLRTRDITLLIWLCRARTRLGQAAGLFEALRSLAEVLRRWPAQVHPQTLVEGELDPAVRANALAALADPEGLLGDVRDVVVMSNTAMRLSVRDVERAYATTRLPASPNPEAVTRQLDHLRASDSADAPSAVRLLARAAAQVRAIETWSRDYLGDEAPSLVPLRRLLELFEVDVAASTGESSLDRDHGEAAPATRFCDPLTTVSEPGPIASRKHASHNIRIVRAWFERHEPSSPVAVLLRQAERMVGLRFLQVADAIPLELLRKWETQEVGDTGVEP